MFYKINYVVFVVIQYLWQQTNKISIIYLSYYKLFTYYHYKLIFNIYLLNKKATTFIYMLGR